MKTELDIAVVGMSGRFPGAGNISEYWKNLAGSVESITFFNEEKNNAVLDSLDSLSSKLNGELYKDSNYVHAGYVLDNIEEFDAGFFGYNPSEAELIDPQHRIFLETVWEAFEDAGYDPLTHDARTGIFAGTGQSKYFIHNVFTNREIWYSERDLTALIGNEVDYLATRVAYKLNLRGPAMAVESACSSSLVAIHLACQSIRNKECDMAIAGGSIVAIPHNNGYLYREGGLYSRDGHCRVFDEKASGTVFANGGAGCVLLKPLELALEDGDHIYAVVKGAAVSNDGNDKSVMTAPSVSGQVAAAKQAIARAGIDPRSISYVEAHGTGTSLGDPTEVSSLSAVFRQYTDENQFCALGSVKTNVGHLDRVAGVAGFIKTALALKHKQLPASLHFEKPNPRIDFENSPFFVNTTLAEWDTDQLPRRAGINSFGVGGTNAHAILEEAPQPRQSDKGRPWSLLSFSARSKDALSAQASRLLEHLEKNPDGNLNDVAFTLHCGRHHFAHRQILVASDVNDAIACLKSEDPKRLFSGSAPTHDRNLVFMFSGQGSQHVNMGRELYQEEPIYRDVIDSCAALLENELGLDIRTLLYPDAGEEKSASQKLMQTSLTQPALFVTEYAMAKLLMAWGVQAQAMVGHSIGEYVAACMAGVFTLEEAIKLVALRGRLMQDMPGGSMLSVALTEEELVGMLNDQLSLAAVNGPNACVVSGTDKAIEAFKCVLEEKQIACSKLQTSHAFHSYMMDPVLSQFTEVVRQMELKEPEIPYLSNVIGTWISKEQATDPEYWANHLRGTVRFAKCINTIVAETNVVLLEVGPGNTLGTLSRQCLDRGTETSVVTTMHHPKDPQPSLNYLMNALGKLWCAGVVIDWKKFYADQTRQRISLPSYPFERQRYWIDAPKYEMKGHAAVNRPAGFEGWFSIPSWHRTLSPVVNQNTDGDDLDTTVWLVFTEKGDIGPPIVEWLRSSKRKVKVVASGAEFNHDEDNFILDPGNAAHYDAMVEALTDNNKLPDLRVLHLWGLNEVNNIGDTEATKQCLDHGFYSLLYLAQAIGQFDMEASIDIDVISTQIHDVSGNDPLNPQNATILGPCKVIPLEYPNIKCRNIDVDLTSGLGTSVLDTLTKEIDFPSDDSIVAYRNGIRWIQTYEPAQFPALQNKVSKFKIGTVCLITGGLGGLGLEIGRYLAQTASARLVLIGRSALPDRSEWDEYLKTHDDSDRQVSRILKIRELEEFGAEVEVIMADVTDYQQMSAAVEQARNRFGEINGVIHAAGVAGGGMIQLKTRDAADKVLLPKIQGALILDSLLLNDPLDYFVLCSSLFSVVGGIGQVDYCAANTFFDVFGQSRHMKNGYPCISINWDAWQEIGMAVNEMERSKARLPRSSGMKMDHPLLSSRVENGQDRVVYEASYKVDDLWVLDEHKVLGNSMIPGTGYLEITRAAFESIADGKAIQISDALFMAPLVVQSDTSEQIRVVVTREQDDYTVVISSQMQASAGQQSQWKDHFSARLTTSESAVTQAPVLDEILQRCDEMELNLEGQTPMPTDEWEKSGFILFGPRWRNIKSVHVGEKEILLSMELPEQFHSDLEIYKLHPSLLDMATGVTMISLLCPDVAGEGQLYLPWSYDRIRIHAPLSSRIYSHSRYREEDKADQQTLTLDVCLFDESGNVLVEIEGFTVRKVPEHLLQAPQSQADKAAPAASQSSTAVSAKVLGGEGIPPADGIEAFERIMGHGAISQVVVSTMNLENLLEDIAQISQSSVDKSSASDQPVSSHPRPDIPTAYVAPTNDVEQTLADLWKSVLGIDKVGIHDNVFELGADSVIGVQVVSKARSQGILLSPNQLFEYQTVAELAAIASPASERNAEKSETGPWPLSPIQYQMMENSNNPAHSLVNSFLFELGEKIEFDLLEKAVKLVSQRHEALGLRFAKNDNAWRIELADPFDGVRITHTKVKNFNLDQRTAFTSVEMDLLNDPLLQLTFIESGEVDQEQYLMVVAHELLFDATSIEILLADLQSTYNAIVRDQPVTDPVEKASLQRWMNALQQRIESDTLTDEMENWLNDVALLGSPLPVDHGDPKKVAVHPRSIVSVSLNSDLSRSLLEDEVHSAYSTNINDILLSSLVQAICRWSKNDTVLVDIKTTGRSLAISDLDLSHTVGQFGLQFPALLGCGESHEPIDVLKAVKERLRQLPAGGMGFGILRYLGKDEVIRQKLDSVMPCQLSFEYCGSPGHSLNDLSMFAGPTSLSSASINNKKNMSQDELSLISLSALYESGQLHVNWSYASDIFDDATVTAVANDFITTLTTLIEHCQSSQVGSFTPSDFPQSGIRQDELDALESLFVNE